MFSRACIFAVLWMAAATITGRSLVADEVDDPTESVQESSGIIQLALSDPLAALEENESPWLPQRITIAQVPNQQRSLSSTPSARSQAGKSPPTETAANRAAAGAPPTSFASRRRSLGTATGFASLASVPYMIGDTGSGTCLAFSGILSANLSHPTLTCSRLNISENNSTLPQDRVYYSYRHFHNATEFSIYQFTKELGIDRHTVAMEKTFAQGNSSIEVRVPIEKRLTSNIKSPLLPDQGILDLIQGDDEQVELANISIILKSLLYQSQRFACSAGLGITLPTANDVSSIMGFDGQVTFPNFPGIVMDTFGAFDIKFHNQTFYLSPFVSWLYRPSSRLFYHGFSQLEFAANPSSFEMIGGSFNDFYAGGAYIGSYHYGLPNPFQGELNAQSLARLNLGSGYIFYEDLSQRRARRLTGLLELHYTSPLEDAKLTKVPVNVFFNSGFPPLQDISVGNQANRVDILNLATGLATDICNWKITNGIVTPLRTGTNRGFDFEYNMQVQRRF